MAIQTGNFNFFDRKDTAIASPSRGFIPQRRLIFFPNSNDLTTRTTMVPAKLPANRSEKVTLGGFIISFLLNPIG